MLQAIGLLMVERLWGGEPKKRSGNKKGAVAQLGEHLLCKEGVRSSNLLGSTSIFSWEGLRWFEAVS